MPSNLIHDSSDEAAWIRAKELAAKSGHAKDWPYVTHIFENIKNHGHQKTAAGPVGYLKNLWHQASGAGKATAEVLHARNEKKLEEAVRAWKGARDAAVSRVGLREYAKGRAKAGVPALGGRVLDRAQRRAHLGMQRAQEHLDDITARSQKTQDNLEKARAESSQAKRKVLLGAGVAGGAGLLVHKLRHRQAPEGEKAAADKKRESVNWKRVALMGAGMGLAVGGLKGYAEEAVKGIVTKRLLAKDGKLLSRLKLNTPDGAERAARGLGRGLTSAGGGVVYATGTAMGLKKDEKKGKK